MVAPRPPEPPPPGGAIPPPSATGASGLPAPPPSSPRRARASGGLPFGARLLRAAAVGAVLGVLVSVTAVAIVVLRHRGTADTATCGSVTPSARLDRYTTAPVSPGASGLVDMTVEVEVTNRLAVPIVVDNLSVPLGIPAPVSGPRQELPGRGGPVAAGATESFEARGLVFTTDSTGRPVNLTERLPDEAVVHWRPTDTMVMVRCSPYRQTNGRITGRWPPCANHPSGEGRVCRDLVGGAPSAPDPNALGLPHRLAVSDDGAGAGAPGGREDVEVQVVNVSRGGCEEPGAQPERGHHLTIIVGIKGMGPPHRSVTADDFSVEGPDDGVDAPAGARCNGGAGTPMGPPDLWRFVIDTRYEAGTLVFTHPELVGAARWTFALP